MSVSDETKAEGIPRAGRNLGIVKYWGVFSSEMRRGWTPVASLDDIDGFSYGV